MFGLTMNMPLLISSVIRHAAEHHGDTEIASRGADDVVHRYTYADAHRRACRLAHALVSLGVVPGDRVATLAWNTHRHYELYYGVSGLGAVCHTINPRLFVDQIVFIVNHAADRFVFFDASFQPLVDQIAPRCPKVERWILLADTPAAPTAAVPHPSCYEELIAGRPDTFDWPELDERTACGLCYTSGTTGNPKGALFSHRSTLLHAFAISMPDAVSISASDTVAFVSPMFHVMSWGLPYAATMIGSRLVLPGPRLDGASLYRLFEDEQVTISGAVPTVWFGVIAYMREQGVRLSSLKRVLIGGSACPPALIAALQDEFGVEVIHGWGMTETGPLATASQVKHKHRGISHDDRLALQAKQGRAVFGVEMKIVGDDGAELPHDGTAFGDLLVRGLWISSGYYEDERNPMRNGWFCTGDVASIDPDGYLQIVDRSKDLIKSGGEWISSIELESLAVSHPAVQEAAAIAVPHPTWSERPLMVVVLRKGASLTRDELLAFYRGKVARWCEPNDVVFVSELPRTATGKLLKTKLRVDYKDHAWPLNT